MKIRELEFLISARCERGGESAVICESLFEQQLNFGHTARQRLYIGIRTASSNRATQIDPRTNKSLSTPTRITALQSDFLTVRHACQRDPPRYHLAQRSIILHRYTLTTSAGTSEFASTRHTFTEHSTSVNSAQHLQTPDIRLPSENQPSTGLIRHRRSIPQCDASAADTTSQLGCPGEESFSVTALGRPLYVRFPSQQGCNRVQRVVRTISGVVASHPSFVVNGIVRLRLSDR